MARTVLPPLILLLFAFATHGVQAGTSEAPEVVDAEGDASFCIEGPACVPSQAAFDVTAGWVDAPDGATIGLHLVVAEAPPAPGVLAGVALPPPLGFCMGNGATFQYEFHFQAQQANGEPIVEADAAGNGITDLYAFASAPCDTASAGPGALDWSFGLYYTYEGAGGVSGITALPASGSVAGSQFDWVVPRASPVVAMPEGDAAAGYLVGNIVVQSSFVPQAASGSLTIPVDTGPDEGFGTPFMMPGGAPAVAAPTFHEVTTSTFDLASSTSEPTNRTEVYNWTSSGGDLEVGYVLESSAGTLHLLVTDAAGASILDRTVSSTTQDVVAVPEAAAGTWQVTLTYTDFVGDVQFSIQAADEQTAAPPAAPPAPPPADGSANDDAEGGFPLQEEKDTPAAGVLAATLALVALALAMRRRLA